MRDVLEEQTHDERIKRRAIGKQMPIRQPATLGVVHGCRVEILHVRVQRVAARFRHPLKSGCQCQEEQEHREQNSPAPRKARFISQSRIVHQKPHPPVDEHRLMPESDLSIKHTPTSHALTRPPISDHRPPSAAGDSSAAPPRRNGCPHIASVLLRVVDQDALLREGSTLPPLASPHPYHQLAARMHPFPGDGNAERGGGYPRGAFPRTRLGAAKTILGHVPASAALRTSAASR